jgi:hypothetical protein
MRVRPHRLWDRAARLWRYGAVRAARWPEPATADHAPIVREVDVVVVGGGLAGLAAAEAAAAAGLSVILAERTPQLGGIADGYGGLIEGEAIDAWIAAHAAALAARGSVEILTSATVAALAPGFALIVERPNAPIPLQRLWQVSAGAIVLATGAAEKPLVFPGNHGPGVMLAGAARLLQATRATAPRSTCTPPASRWNASSICGCNRKARWPISRAPRVCAWRSAASRWALRAGAAGCRLL